MVKAMKRQLAITLVLGGLGFIGASILQADEPLRKAAWYATSANPPAVVCDGPASEPMEFAATELRRYLGRILGAPLSDAPRNEQSPAIRLSVRSDAPPNAEGYEFRADGNVYRIVGDSPLGLVFGTYEFLRRTGGCRYSDLGPDGEYVPQKNRLEADPGPLKIEPKLVYRGLQFSFYEDPELCRQRIDWMAKNGMNYVMYMPEPDDADPETTVTVDPQSGQVRLPKHCEVYWRFTKGWFDKVLRPEVRKRGLKLDMNHHNLLYWLPTRRYLAKHPEWYSEIDGKRGVDFKQLCICTSNPEAVATLIQNVRTYLRENPEVKVVGVIPQDHIGMCQCKRCVAGDPDPKDAFRETDWASGNRSKSLRYAKLLNAVAEAIRREFPDVTVGGEAYHDLMQPPGDIAIDPQTTIWLAVHARDGCRPLATDGTSKTNQKIFETLEQWKKVYRGRLILYEYYMGLNAHRSLPYPLWEVICEDWNNLKRLGVEGATVQCWSTNHSLYALNLLAFARCGWSDQVNPAEVLDDYLQGAFGSAGESVRPIFAGLAEAVRRRAKEPGDMRPNVSINNYFLNQIGRDAISRSLKTAQAKADDERERRQLKKLAAAVNYWEMSADVFDRFGKAKRLAKSDPRKALGAVDYILDQQWAKFDEMMQWSAAPGWICITAPNQWAGTKQAAASLREKLLSEVAMDAKDVKIRSSKDGTMQSALFWSPKQSADAVPLLVGLHSWSAKYTQENGYLELAKKHGWAVILPDFRGPNLRPEACASDLAVQDVLEAVEYAKQHARIDPRRIYLVGGSGGGHMSLVMAGRVPKLWAGVSAWVPISDLAAWHAESAKRKNVYAKMMEQVCGGKPGTPETDQQYRARSPLTYLAAAKGLPIDINTGIHDGHKGSVPVSHSLRAFNLLAEINGHPEKKFSEEQIKVITDSETIPAELVSEKIDRPGFTKPILFHRTAGPVQITIFDGGHELIAPAACQWLVKQRKAE
jgi:poly(3-hydroxybutyrate) depolymerase